jgi:NAD(P)-dependent dehydrogenase (short-subunit alcohol dehydrogenase family)
MDMAELLIRIAPMKTFVVTGASTGIGRELTLSLAREGHRVVMVSRNPERAAAAVERVRAEGKGEVLSLLADLSLLSEARRVGHELESMIGRLDALVLNAAVIPPRRALTPEGFETAFATNALSPLVLLDTLLPRLKSSAPSRVVTFFGGNEPGGMDFDDLQSEKGRPSGFKLYGRSKLVVAMLTVELARRLKSSGVTVNAAWPGIVNTEGMRAIPGAIAVMMFLIRPMMRTVAQGAQAPLYAATASELEGVTGRFFGAMFGDARKEMPAPEPARDEKAAVRVYEACARLAGIAP